MRKLLAKYLKWRGWVFLGEIPPIPKLIIVGAPHTSNFDFFIFLAALHHYDIRVAYIGKHTLFRWPFGHLMRRWGGIPVDRSRAGGLVSQVVEAMGREEEMILVIAPEGTRTAAPHWKRGFLSIAQRAPAPIVFAGLDYSEKKVEISAPVRQVDDEKTVMDTARAFYSDINGRNPEGVSMVRLKEEPRTSRLVP